MRSPSRRGAFFAYGAEKVRGVNLGGWLLLEPWITPSLFQQFVGDSSPAVNEYTFCQNLGYANAQAQLEAHWATFYTEADFQNFVAWGINHIRIPIGCWAYDIQPGEPWVYGAGKYLAEALVWATNTGFNVWIDLHGAPGSQNGTEVFFRTTLHSDDSQALIILANMVRLNGTQITTIYRER